MGCIGPDLHFKQHAHKVVQSSDSWKYRLLIVLNISSQFGCDHKKSSFCTVPDTPKRISAFLPAIDGSVAVLEQGCDIAHWWRIVARLLQQVPIP